MNIFSLNNCPKQSAKWLCDKHMKMLLESCQLLCTTFHLQGIGAPYRPTHKNHPSAIWCRTSLDNFKWLIEHAYAISDEYTSRYDKIHKSSHVLKWCDENMYRLSFPSKALTKFTIAISDNSICRTLPEFDESDPVNCYRLYYIHDKKHIHQWKRNKPNWIV